jgi:hypothetical protein
MLWWQIGIPGAPGNAQPLSIAKALCRKRPEKST